MNVNLGWGIDISNWMNSGIRPWFTSCRSSYVYSIKPSQIHNPCQSACAKQKKNHKIEPIHNPSPSEPASETQTNKHDGTIVKSSGKENKSRSYRITSMYVLALATVVRLNSSLNRLDLKARSWSYFLLVSPIIEDTAAHLHMYILCMY